MKETNELIQVLIKIESQKEMYTFLKGILTPKELQEISTRLQLVKLLKKGIPQQKIAKILGIGIATVTRGSKEVQLGRFNNI